MSTDEIEQYPFPTLLVHADDHLAPTTDIAPALHPSTTYHYPVKVEEWRPVGTDNREEISHLPVYSRLSYSTAARVEKVLGELMGGHAVTYCSGLTAIHALFVHINPKKACISQEAGYHGTKGVARILKRLSNLVSSYVTY
jgi:cystathionine gamma-synthase